jgi:hypothetical protein
MRNERSLTKPPYLADPPHTVADEWAIYYIQEKAANDYGE